MVGDRVVFVRNDYRVGYRNGTFGTVRESSGGQLRIELDRGVEGRVGEGSADLRHGYASTIHRAQGITVDRTYLFAGRHLDRHRGLVGWTRHRQDLRVFWDRQTYANGSRLISALSRGGRNGLVRDYLEPKLSPARLAPRVGAAEP